MTIHDLKLNDRFFDAVLYKRKTFEIRKNDRDYAVGDTLTLRRVDDKGNYIRKGEASEIDVEVTYILTHEDFPAGVPKGYIVMAIELVERSAI